MDNYNEGFFLKLSNMAKNFREKDYWAVISLGKNSPEKFKEECSIYFLYFMGKSYEKVYDFIAASRYYLALTSLDTSKIEIVEAFEDIDISVNTRMFFFTGLNLLGRGNYEAALENFLMVLKYDANDEAAFYYAGVSCLYLERTDEAVHFLQESILRYEDPAKIFSLGCAAYLKGEMDLAKEFFSQTLARNSMVCAAEFNLNILRDIEHNAQIIDLQNLPQINMDYMAGGCHMEPYKNIPIFINSRDRVDCLRALVACLLKKGYENIYILDNASTYPMLKEYYTSLNESPVQVIYLSENMGHRALWEAKILDRLNIKTPYIYTDSDVLPMDECPEDFVLYMLKILRQNSTIQKVGLSLRLDDVPVSRFPENERQFWELEFAPNLYYAYTDTTFALYRAGRRFYINEAIRIGYPYMARHLPWYYDMDNLPADEVYYMERANASSTFAKTYQEKT